MHVYQNICSVRGFGLSALGGFHFLQMDHPNGSSKWDYSSEFKRVCVRPNELSTFLSLSLTLTLTLTHTLTHSLTLSYLSSVVSLALLHTHTTSSRIY